MNRPSDPGAEPAVSEHVERALGSKTGQPASENVELKLDRRPGGWLFWASAAVGWLIIANGLRGVLVNDVDTRPFSLARFVVGGALVHDLLFAPLVILAGVGLARVLRGGGRSRAIVQAAAIVSGVVALFAFPLVRGYGRVFANPSSLPRNYGAGLAVTVGAVWAVALVVLAVGALRRRRPGPRPTPA